MPLRGAVVLSLCGAFTLGCNRGGAKAPVAVEVSSSERESSAAEPSAVAAPSSRPFVVDTPEESGLFIRLGDALMPMACFARGSFAKDDECVDGVGSASLTIYPPLLGEASTVRATPSNIYFAVSDTRERGLLINGAKPGTEDASDPRNDPPLVGFGVAGTRNPIRFTPAVLAELTNELASWCEKEGCTRPSRSATSSLAVRNTSQATRSAVELALGAVLARKLPARPPTVQAKSMDVFVSGQREELVDVTLDLAAVLGEDASSAYPQHFLVSARGDHVTPLSTLGAYGSEMGETGEVMAAVDLDGDGTDELILDVRYETARSYRLVRREQDRLVVLGEYGRGC